MRHLLSLAACLIVFAVLLQYRVTTITPQKPLNVTRWDAFGYYMYLPAIFIYHDYKKLSWLDSIDRKYQLTGGNGWEAIRLDNGNYTYKYLGGVAIMQLPLFLAGHLVACNSHYPSDGFSPPYQYALSFGALLYCCLAILLLRRILLRYFTDATAAITIILLCLASNFMEYAAYGNGLSHAYIFALYVAVLYTTLKWHEQPQAGWALMTGYIIGLATMSRPTEAIMLFIPLLWNTHNREVRQDKWRKLARHKVHIVAALLGGLAGILPQLIYWKLSTGSFIYDVGSKWVFLNPWFRVLLGWEKGWFIYTPATVFFVLGLFFVKKYPFRNSVIWFCLLNIWIIISWDEWRYGGSYSTRALVQSYPVFALSLAAFTKRVRKSAWRPAYYLAGTYLVCVNIFQVYQYNKTILHYDDMNRKYYGRIYLNSSPTPLDMSLLDNDDILKDENGFRKDVLFHSDSSMSIDLTGSSKALFAAGLPASVTGEEWLRIDASVLAPGTLWKSYLATELRTGDSVKQNRVRLFSPISKDSALNRYQFYVRVPSSQQPVQLTVNLSTEARFNGMVQSLTVTRLTK